jgi:hypothetical protein
MTRIRQMSADDVESILARYGFEFVSQSSDASLLFTLLSLGG